jgi:integrase
MIHSVEKRRCRRNGKLCETRSYYLRYRYGAMPSDKWKSLGVTDKQVAEKKASEFRRESENEAEGILEPRLIRDAAKKPLLSHLDDYVADLKARERAGRNGRGASLTKSRIFRLLSECGWKLAYNVTPDSFSAWRNQQKGAARTVNHYLQGMVSFLNWLERVGRIKTNPLKFVAKVDERGKKRRVRRAFTEEELAKLVKGSGPRGIVYLMAARTGLRQEELKQLRWADVHLDSAAPYVLAQASTTKNKKEEPLPLVPELAQALREYRPARFSPNDRVFPNIPRASRLKVDAANNGIPYRDELGRYADFHALRYTWDTFLTKNGVLPRIVQKLMRHSDPRLSATTYLDQSQLPIQAAITALPRLAGYTQIRAQISGAEGQNGSQAVATVVNGKSEERPMFDGVRRVLSQGDAEKEMERAKGFEPSTLTLAT